MYNLATSKADKARVAKEVIQKVTSLNPPGRFLTRDPSGGIGSWWVEIDEVKAMAKTSQALREGAPTIRAQHQQEVESVRKTSKRARRDSTSVHTLTDAKNPVSHPQPTPNTTVTPSGTPECVPSKNPTAAPTTNQTKTPVVPPLVSNPQFHETYARPAKRGRIEEVQEVQDVDTPTLLPVVATDTPVDLLLDAAEPQLPAPQQATSLPAPAEDWVLDGDLKLGDFVNPFENEEEILQTLFKTSDGDCAFGTGSIRPEDWPLIFSVQ